MTAKKPPPVESRYDWVLIARRVTTALVHRTPPGEKRPIGIKELAGRLGVTDAKLRKQLFGLREKGPPRPPRTPLTVKEAGQIATIYNAPGLWPFEDWPADAPKK